MGRSREREEKKREGLKKKRKRWCWFVGGNGGGDGGVSPVENNARLLSLRLRRMKPPLFSLPFLCVTATLDDFINYMIFKLSFFWAFAIFEPGI